MSDYKKVNIDPDEYKEPEPSKPGNVVKSETKEWPPQVGIWKDPQRQKSLLKLRLNPAEELVDCFIPEPGFIANGVGIMGRQLLPKGLLNDILSTMGIAAEHETVFRMGGKEKSTFLGNFKG